MKLTQKDQEVLEFVTKYQGELFPNKLERKKQGLELKLDAIGLLKSCKLGEKYIFAALCHDLLENPEVKEEELIELIGIEVVEAVKIIDMRKNPSVSRDDYFHMIKENEIANIAIMATLAAILNNATNYPREMQDKLLMRAEKEYLDFSNESPAFFFIKEAYENLKASYAS